MTLDEFAGTLRTLYDEQERLHEGFERYLRTDEPSDLPRGRTEAAIKADIHKLLEECPAAAAYLTARRKSKGKWFEMDAGKKAMARLVSGDDPKKVLAAMQKEISEKLNP